MNIYLQQNKTSITQLFLFIRAMAVCVSLMMGRVGSVVGANLVGILLDNYCEVVFSTSGAFLIGM